MFIYSHASHGPSQNLFIFDMWGPRYIEKSAQYPYLQVLNSIDDVNSHYVFKLFYNGELAKNKPFFSTLDDLRIYLYIGMKDELKYYI